MFEEYLKQIEEGLDVRKNLIGLRDALKKSAYKVPGQMKEKIFQICLKALSHEDAKARKNAALILGELGSPRALKPLLDAYLAETQLFVKSSYLQAMNQLDYRPVVDRLKTREQEIMAMERTQEMSKHLDEELRLLRDMIMKVCGSQTHAFTGYHVPSELILVTSPGLENLTADQLSKDVREHAKVLRGGVSVKAEHPGRLLKIRTVKGMLFRFCRNPLPDKDYKAVAQYIWKAGIYRYLQMRHEGDGPFNFRIDMKTSLVLHEKSQYIRRLAGALEEVSGYRLRNSASNYEIEIRLMENRQGDYIAYLKLDTIKDTRFAYRTSALATSMHPVRAAEVIAMADPYLAEEALVFDPMCGTGALLIERGKAVETRSLYGTDIFGEAIEGLRSNAAKAEMTVYGINRDFRDFTHDYAFDEIITEFPAVSARMTEGQLEKLYQDFVRCLPSWLGDQGKVFAVVTMEEAMKAAAQALSGLKLISSGHFSGKRDTALMIFEYTKG